MEFYGVSREKVIWTRDAEVEFRGSWETAGTLRTGDGQLATDDERGAVESFTIYPAVDLRAGRVVRLRQGKVEDETVYGEDPVSVARGWQEQGVSWLHLVDLDGALGDASSPNAAAIRAILGAVKIPIQLGGGIRNRELIKQALELGISRVVIGTFAVERTEEFATAVQSFGADAVAVAVDIRDGRVATRGWRETSGIDAIAFGKQMYSIGVRRAVVTDIARDGMLSGMDAEAMARFAQLTGLGVIASGGAAHLDDVRALCQRVSQGVQGVILGQALYTGAIALREAIDQVNFELRMSAN